MNRSADYHPQGVKFPKCRACPVFTGIKLSFRWPKLEDHRPSTCWVQAAGQMMLFSIREVICLTDVFLIDGSGAVPVSQVSQ